MTWAAFWIAILATSNAVAGIAQEPRRGPVMVGGAR